MPLDVVTLAYDHARAGRPVEAVTLLEAAGARGNAVALAELATWYLRGDLIPRDLGRARAMLRQAVTVGHVDAALREIAFTANGTGGPINWGSAMALLRRAAATDSIAALHLGLLDAMELDTNGYPIALPPTDVLAASPIIFRVPGALSPAECLHLAGVGHADLAPAVVIDHKSGRNVPHPIRTSHGAAIGPAQEDLVIAALNRRIATITNTALDNGEPLQILRYTPGQQYRLHSDAVTGAANQRIVTAIVYLNDGFGGGETDFPVIRIRVQPRAGDVLVFHNAEPGKPPDARVRHAGLPVIDGVKWIATRWIRAAHYDPWNPP